MADLSCEHIVVVLQTGLRCSKVHYLADTPFRAEEHGQTRVFSLFGQKHLEICPFCLQRRSEEEFLMWYLHINVYNGGYIIISVLLWYLWQAFISWCMHFKLHQGNFSSSCSVFRSFSTFTWWCILLWLCWEVMLRLFFWLSKNSLALQALKNETLLPSCGQEWQVQVAVYC